MKKAFSFVLALFVCFSLVLTMGACAKEENPIENEKTTYLKVEGKKDSVKLLNEFFAGTRNNDNYVATSVDGDYKRTESIKGDANYIESTSSETVYWAFKRGEKFICAVSTKNNHYYLSGEKYYNGYYRTTLSSISVIERIAEQGFTFECVTKTVDKVIDDKTIETTVTLSFSAISESTSINISATSKDGLVERMVYTTIDFNAGETSTMTTTFVYGNATVTLPDITDWSDITSTGEEDEE